MGIDISSVVDKALLSDAWALKLREQHLIGPHILGIEITQGIQYFRASRHLTDPADRGANNSLRLVAHKTAWVRVYVRAGWGGAVNLTGHLQVSAVRNKRWLPVWTHVGTLAPQTPGTVTAQALPDYATERGTTTATLNFIVPAEDMAGTMSFKAEIWRADDATAAVVDSETVEANVTLLQTLRVRGLMVAYNGPNAAGNGTLNIAAPTVGQLQTTAAWSHTIFPVQADGVFSSAGTVTLTVPLTGSPPNPGGCSAGWITLNGQLAAAKANDGNRTDVVYYGLLPNGVPMGPVIGCASNGVTSGGVGNGTTMAHELGHFAGLPHAPCGTPGNAAYPAYEPYDPAGTPTASIGEYGLDINNGAIHRPDEKDFMSYCPPRWTSIFTHQVLINNAIFAPTSVHPRFRIPELYDPWLWPWEYIPDPAPEPWEHWRDRIEELRMRPVITLIGTFERDASITMQHVMRVNAQPNVATGVPTQMVAELVGANGEVLASAPVMRIPADAHGGGCGCGGGCGDGEPPVFGFQAMVPDVGRGAALRIVHVGALDDAEGKLHRPLTVAWERKASGRAVKLGEVGVKPGPRGVTLAWKVDGTGADGAAVSCSVQFSKDGGRSWNGCAVGLTEGKALIAADTLPSGKLLFRVLAHDGFDTVVRTSDAVEIAARAPNVAVMNPSAGARVETATPMRLWAHAQSGSGERIESEAFEWRLDGETVGRGRELWIIAPKPGPHEATVVVTDGRIKGEASTAFTTFGPDRDTPSPRKTASRGR